MNPIGNSEKDLVIIGGGITGLSAAYLAAREGRKVVVIEAANTFGGLLNTFEIGNNRLEYYYHHFFTHDEEINWLIKDLNIEDKLHFYKTSMGVFKNGRIFQFNTFIDLLRFKPIKLIDKILFGITSVYLGKFAKWSSFEHISCLKWFEKWAGTTTTSSLWAPLLKIKFGPYAKEVPLSWMIGRLRQRINSRKKGDEKLGYLEGSLQVLLDALLKRLNEMNVELISSQSVESIRFIGNEILSVKTQSSEFSGKQFLFTIPGTNIARLLLDDFPDYSDKLNRIKYFGAICLVLELNRPLSNIYWLNIADKGFPFGGIIEHTNFISPEQYNGSHIAYLSRYFAMEEDIAVMNREEIEELMTAYLPKIYQGFQSYWVKNTYVFRTNTAATVCDLAFSEKVPDFKTPINNMFIANMSHVYPDERSTNNSIRVAAEACRKLGVNTNFISKTNSLSGKIGF